MTRHTIAGSMVGIVALATTFPLCVGTVGKQTAALECFPGRETVTIEGTIVRVGDGPILVLDRLACLHAVPGYGRDFEDRENSYVPNVSFILPRVARPKPDLPGDEGAFLDRWNNQHVAVTGEIFRGSNSDEDFVIMVLDEIVASPDQLR